MAAAEAVQARPGGAVAQAVGMPIRSSTSFSHSLPASLFLLSLSLPLRPCVRVRLFLPYQL